MQAGEYLLFQTAFQLLFHLVQLLFRILFPRYDIELGGGRGLFRVHLVSGTCGAKGSFLVEIFRVTEFGGNGIAQIARSQLLVHRGILGSHVTSLYHEILDHTVEQ